jgi:hypothetical protein
LRPTSRPADPFLGSGDVVEPVEDQPAQGAQGTASGGKNPLLPLADNPPLAPTIDWILEKARAAVLRHGVRGLVIDPYNEVEHHRDRNMNAAALHQIVEELAQGQRLERSRAPGRAAAAGRRHGLKRYLKSSTRTAANVDSVM